LTRKGRQSSRPRNLIPEFHSSKEQQLSEIFHVQSESEDSFAGNDRSTPGSQIWTTFALNPYLSANDIKVSVREGKATLSGIVADGVNKDLARQIALGVNGIKPWTTISRCRLTICAGAVRGARLR
jgi:hypothetical protein